MPHRLKRTGLRGRIPQGARYVGRPTRWGNPWHVDEDGTRQAVVERYRRALLEGELRVTVEDVQRELRGFDLVCHCPPDEPCHADVLLDVANGGDKEREASDRS
jgi:hypothetical protein